MNKLYFCFTLLFLEAVPTGLFGQESLKDSIVQGDSMDEVVVTRKSVIHKSGRDVYIITPKKLEGMQNSMDLLRTVPGVTIDIISQNVSVKRDSRVLLLVEGERQPIEFFQTLRADIITKIEVVYMIPEKFKAEGFRYVINIILKKEKGERVSIQNLAMFSPGNNGDDLIANEQPKLNFMHSDSRLRTNMGYGYANIHWNYPLTFTKEHPAEGTYTSANNSPFHPNETNHSVSNHVYAGFDYSFSPTRTMHMRTNYLHTNESQSTRYDFQKSRLLQTSYYIEEEHFGNSSHDDDFNILMSYKNQINTKLNYTFNISYDNKDSKMFAFYNDENTLSDKKYRNTKNFIETDIDANYSINDVFSFNGGYLFMWNKYSSKLLTGNNISENIFSYHRLHLYSDINLGKYWYMHIGLGTEIRKSYNYIKKTLYKKLLPSIQLSYMPSNNFQAIGEASIQSVPPNQYQLSEASRQIDRNTWVTGSTTLEPTIKKTLALQMTFWERLTLGMTNEYQKNHISEYYTQSNNTCYKSFVNDHFHYLSLIALYDWEINRNLNFSNSVSLSSERLTYKELHAKRINVTISSRLSWYVRKIKLNADFEYDKSMVRSPVPQGYNETGQDLWQFSLRKSWLKNRINVSLGYVPPIHMLVSTEQQRIICTPFYNEKQSLNLRTYDNLLLLRITINLHRGKNYQMKDLKDSFIDETEKGRGLL